MTEKAKKAVILARVSSREQEDGYSIEAQKYRLQEYCTRKGLEILKIFEFQNLLLLVIAKNSWKL